MTLQEFFKEAPKAAVAFPAVRTLPFSCGQPGNTVRMSGPIM